jgi:hypothetical protein
MSLRAESRLREQFSAAPAYARVGVELLALSAASRLTADRRADNRSWSLGRRGRAGSSPRSRTASVGYVALQNRLRRVCPSPLFTGDATPEGWCRER